MRVSSSAFIENLGQWDAQARFLARTPGVDVWVTESGVVYNFLPGNAKSAKNQGGHVVSMEFVDGSPSPVKGDLLLEGRFNYFLGNDPSRWASNVPRFAEARSERIYDGVEARWYFDRGVPRYDLIVAPGADPGKIGLRFSGNSSLSVENGRLVLGTSKGPVEHKGLYAYQVVDGTPKRVDCEFAATRGVVRFDVGDYDTTRPLVIDPLVWSTFIGGGSTEIPGAIKLDGSGNPMLVGQTSSTNFPTTVGAYDRTRTSSDGFVIRLSADGSTLLFGTFLGGSLGEVARCFVWDTAGNILVGGQTQSNDFPTTAGAWDSVYGNGHDGFVAKLSADGSSLLFGTYLGGTAWEDITGIVCDSNGRAIVVGHTTSGTFPTTAGAFDRTFSSGTRDAFATKFDATGSSLLFSTYLGGTDNDLGVGVHLDSSGNVIVTGWTGSGDFPVTPGSYDTTFNNDGDIFIAKLSPTASSMIWCTYYGGFFDDAFAGSALDQSGNIVVCGTTRSLNLPTNPNAFDKTYSAEQDAFVVRISASGTTLLGATYLGGLKGDNPNSVTIDPSGNAVVVGITTSPDYPVTGGALQTAYSGTGFLDGFVTRVSPDASRVLYSTFLGKAAEDRPTVVATDSLGDAVIAGYTFSTDFPTTPGAFATSMLGTSDMFVCKLSITQPAAVNDGYGVNAKSLLSVAAPGPLANDSNTTNTAIVVTPPSRAASFVFNPDGSFEYKPAASFTGIDTFSYEFENDYGTSNTATVSISVRAVLYSMKVDPNTIPGGSTLNGTVKLTTPAKPGGVQVFFSDAQACIQAEGYKITVPEGATSAPFAIPTTPPETAVTATVYCTLANGSGISKSANVTVKPLPKAINDNYKVNANGSRNVAAPGVLGNDNNLMGGTAVLEAGPSNASSFTFNADGSFSYTPATGFIGTDTFTYRCQNAGGLGTVVGTVTMRVRAVLQSMTGLNNPVVGGNPLTGTVTLVGNAPAGGVLVKFSDELTDLKSENYTVLIPAGSASANFSIPTTVVASSVSGLLTAKLDNGSGINKSKTVVINP